MQSCSKNGYFFFVSINQKYFGRMRPNGWLLCFNCASMFSCLLYIFPLRAVKKKPTNSKPDTADPWVSNSGESRKQEKRQAGPAYRDAAWLFHVSPEPAAAGFEPFKGRVPEIPLLAMGSRIQHLSKKLQSIKLLNCYCTKKKTAPLTVQGMVRPLGKILRVQEECRSINRGTIVEGRREQKIDAERGVCQHGFEKGSQMWLSLMVALALCRWP